MVDRMTGTVTQVRLNQGFAFIRGLDGLMRFVYVRDVEPISAFDTLHEGQGVTFEPQGTTTQDPKARNNGLRGVKVRVCP